MRIDIWWRVFFCLAFALQFASGGSASQLDRENLRSAFLIRSGSANYAATQDDAVSQLQAHFDAVVGVLEKSREASLAQAVWRLEQRATILWSDQDRLRAHQQLSESRDQNIANLKAYRDRGRFPINDLGLGYPTPIFVDARDTACAVGHLMRESGWTNEVREIARENNLVYLTDVAAGPAMEWILRSGLLHEEAALIQPSYFEMITGNYTIPESNAGNVRYENFEIEAIDQVPVTNVEHIGAYQDVGLLLSRTTFWNGMLPNSFETTYEPREDDWLFIGHTEYVHRDFAIPARSKHVRLSYDVVPLAGSSIDQFHQSLDNSFNWNLPPLGIAVIAVGNVNVITTVSDSVGNPLATLGLNDVLLDHANVVFAPQSSIHVETEFVATDQAIFNSIIHEFGTSFDIAALDINNDTEVGVADLDILSVAVASGKNASDYDLDRNGTLDLHDVDRWLSQVARERGFAEPFRYGDSNLDGFIASEDLNVVGSHWQSSGTSWSRGDFNADGQTDAADLNYVGLNWESRIAQAGSAAQVPEPPSMTLVFLIGLAAWLRLRRRRSV